MSSATTWHRTPDGYEVHAAGELAALARETGPRGGRGSWVLVFRGVRHDLGRRATFDDAERVLAEVSR